MVENKKEIVMRWREIVSRMRWTIGVLAVVALTSAASLAQRPAKPIPATAVERGRGLFQQHCAACHGERGKGNGPAAGGLSQRPADLTTLAKRKGAFSAAQIEATIRGADRVIAHGSPGIMMWGDAFLPATNPNAHAIAEVIAFIESIQVK